MPHPRRERVPALTLFLTSLPKPQFLFWPPGVLGTRTMAGSLVSLSEPPLYLGQRQEPWVPGCVTLDVRRVIREECLPPSKLTRGDRPTLPGWQNHILGCQDKAKISAQWTTLPRQPNYSPGWPHGVLSSVLWPLKEATFQSILCLAVLGGCKLCCSPRGNPPSPECKLQHTPLPRKTTFCFKSAGSMFSRCPAPSTYRADPPVS